jgi:hypothetical protein
MQEYHDCFASLEVPDPEEEEEEEEEDDDDEEEAGEEEAGAEVASRAFASLARCRRSGFSKQSANLSPAPLISTLSSFMLMACVCWWC